jgi:hypothetical protein
MGYPISLHTVWQGRPYYISDRGLPAINASVLEFIHSRPELSSNRDDFLGSFGSVTLYVRGLSPLEHLSFTASGDKIARSGRYYYGLHLSKFLIGFHPRNVP